MEKINTDCKRRTLKNLGLSFPDAKNRDLAPTMFWSDSRKKKTENMFFNEYDSAPSIKYTAQCPRLGLKPRRCQRIIHEATAVAHPL